MNFKSSVIGPKGERLSLARLPYVRNGPVFHIMVQRPGVEATGVVVQPVELTRNARITATIYQLPDDSRRDRLRIEAYRAYEAATQSTSDESPELWRERAALLRSASSGFKRTGDREQQLWAKYLEAYAHYFPLAEYDRAAEMAEDIQKRAQEHGFREIDLMAMQLEGQALIERSEGDALQTAQAKAERAQAVLERAANLAAEMGYEYERAWALNTRGIGYFYQDRYAEAEQQYRRALEIAIEIQDSGLPKQVRGNLALVRERQGDLHGALAELQALNAQLRVGGETSDLAHNWSELGRLYRKLYLFPEAIDALHLALESWRALNSAEGTGRSALSLAFAYQAMGNLQTSLALAKDAIVEIEAAGYARGLREAYALLANLNRGLGQYKQMTAARDKQANYLNSTVHRARYQYQLGLDNLATYSAEPSRAEVAFAETESLAEATGDAGLRLLARLQRCVNTIQPSEANCAPAVLAPALDKWLLGAPVSQAFEARFLMARNLLNFQRSQEAWMTLNELVSNLQVYRMNLPGVLGAWYWESRAQVFDMYMAQALQRYQETESQPLKSLAAFNRLLNTSLSSPATAPVQARADHAKISNDLRVLLAQLEDGDQAQVEKTRQSIDRMLLALSPALGELPSSADRPAPELDFSAMPADSALLAYYLRDGSSWVWVAQPSGVQIYPLGDGTAIKGVLSRIRSGMRVVGFDELDQHLASTGELLLGPVEQELPRTIYLLGAGNLAGFPFEAIRRNGRYFGQDHDLINVLSLGFLSDFERLDDNVAAWQKILVAGSPLGAEDHLAALPASKRELDGVAKLFEGKSVIRREGENLKLDLIRDPAFASADLIHIASHSRIDLAYPELSRLMMSEGYPFADYLTPLDLKRTSLSAELVVLSACETTGVNSFSFDSNLGFIPAFLQSGAGAVVATLWPVADAFSAEFILAFYATLNSGTNTPQALAETKRRYSADKKAGGNLDWASFQIYFN